MRGWSIRELAERAEVAPMTVQRIERGEGVRVASRSALARAFGINDSLLVGATHREDGPARLAEALGLSSSTVARAGHASGAGTAHDGTAHADLGGLVVGPGRPVIVGSAAPHRLAETLSTMVVALLTALAELDDLDETEEALLAALGRALPSLRRRSTLT